MFTFYNTDIEFVIPVWNNRYVNRKTFARTSLLLCLIAFTFFSASTAHAEDYNPVCAPNESLWRKVTGIFRLDIRRTTISIISSAITDGTLWMTAGMDAENLTRCTINQVSDEFPEAQSLKDDCPGLDPTLLERVKGTGYDQDICDELLTNYNKEAFTSPGGINKSANAQTAGSLLGIAAYLEGGVRYEPSPVNMAYYWEKQTEKIPFVGSANAETTSVRYGNAPFLSIIYDLWLIFRNVAFGMLSLIMVAIGFMIMLRRKLPTQAIVTVQYALPKVVLAVILIAFSYPIGSFLAASMGYVTDITSGLVCQANRESVFSVCPTPVGLVTSLTFVMGVARLGVGPASLGLLAVTMALMLVLYIVAVIRAYIEYLKLIFSIVLAPVQFSFSALPGNGNYVVNWFKNALTHVVSFVAIFMFLDFANIIITRLALGPILNDFSWGRLTGALFVQSALPVIILFAYIQAIRIPGKVKAAIMGDQKKR